jgi:preprotein translocase subunit SecD
VRRKRPVSLIVIVLIAYGWLALTLIAGDSPHLGLDLQGGASVILSPKDGGVPNDSIDQALAIIRNRVDGLGVAEPDIHREGKNIVVALPGVKNAQRALVLVGQTAELRFRPVLCSYAPGGDAAALATCSQYLQQDSTTSTTAVPGATSDSTTTSVPSDASTTSSVDPAGTTGTTEQGFGLPNGESAAVLQTDSSTSTTPTTAATTSTTTGSSDTTATTGGSTTSTTAPAEPTCGSFETPESGDAPDAQVVLPETRDGDLVSCYVLGPTFLTGRAITTAKAEIPNGQWQVSLHLRGGGEGIDAWNTQAEKCFNYDTTCPTRQIAIVLDGVVESAPQIQPQETAFQPFDKDQISISGGSSGFKEGEAKDLSLVLRYGSLPVELVPQTVQTISATLGKDSLHAGLLAGLGGLVLVALYMILYYRSLGLVVVVGMSVWAALNFSIITWLSAKSGLALTLAGVTGIIVSIGVTVDSYVVYFERLKDEVRSGKTIRSSVDRGFTKAFRTIITADVSSFMGAALLYWLTVGSVRGFAFFLGLSTILDVIVTWSFTRPFVRLMSGSRFLTEAKWIGMSDALGGGAIPAPAAGGR